MRMLVREFIVVLLLGFFIGLAVSPYLKDTHKLVYDKEIARLQSWNSELIKLVAIKAK